MAVYFLHDPLCSEWYSDGVLWLSVYSEWYSDGVLWLSVYSEWYSDGVLWLSVYSEWYSDHVLWLSVYKNWESRTVCHAAGQVTFRLSGSKVILKLVILLYTDKVIMKTHNFSPWT